MSKVKKGVKLDTELDADDMKELVSRFKAYYKENKGTDFPTEPKAQLLEAVKAVFRSWENPRAIVYRRMNDMRTVRKNVTLPNYLNEMAMKAGLNFSQVLQEGLKERLGML